MRVSKATGISSTESNVNKKHKKEKKKKAECLVNTNFQKVMFGHTASATVIIRDHRYELPDSGLLK